MSAAELGPKIVLDELSTREQDFFEAWRIPDRSRLVPILDGSNRQFAVWYGEFGARGETPVMAVTVLRREVHPNPLLNWVYGVADRKDVEADHDRIAAMLDAARFPADNLQATLGMLAFMIPAEQAVLL